MPKAAYIIIGWLALIVAPGVGTIISYAMLFIPGAIVGHYAPGLGRATGEQFRSMIYDFAAWAAVIWFAASAASALAVVRARRHGGAGPINLLTLVAGLGLCYMAALLQIHLTPMD
jgi:hypothetical protein